MLGKRLKRFRLARSMTLADLAAAIDNSVSAPTLSKYERGELQPTATALNRIASAFGVKSSQLWSEPPCHVEWIAFRKRARLGERAQERIRAFVAEEIEKRVWLQEQIHEQIIFEFPILGTRVKNVTEKPERFHQQVRRARAEKLITEAEANQLLNQRVAPSTNQLCNERRQFLKLPKEQRDRVLSEQAKEMAVFYEHDTEWREWEGGPVVEYEIP